MEAYMKGRFRFLGVTAPRRREATRELLNQVCPTVGDLRPWVERLWESPYREFQHFGCDWLDRHRHLGGAEFLELLAWTITHKSWWDTVDHLASHPLGDLIRRESALTPVVDAWIESENLWLARSALLHQLRYRQDTDAEKLFGMCRRHFAHPDFFIRKAIGWALREYSKTNPEAVAAFAGAHRRELSGLSLREATRRLPAHLWPPPS